MANGILLLVAGAGLILFWTNRAWLGQKSQLKASPGPVFPGISGVMNQRRRGLSLRQAMITKNVGESVTVAWEVVNNGSADGIANS